jgi:hypothetical protein
MISDTPQSLISSGRGRRSTNRSNGSSKQHVWFPISEDRRNFAKARKTSDSDTELVKRGEIKVEHSFVTNLEAARIRV